MTPERLREIRTRITKNQSAPDVPELAFELIAELEKRHEVDRARKGDAVELGEQLPEAAPPSADAGPGDEEAGGFFSRKKGKK